MFNKLYDNLKNFFLKNSRFFIFFIILAILFTIEFPYRVEIPGGYINVTERIEIDNSKSSKGSFNMAYVSELSGTIPTLLIAFFNPNWDVSKNEDVLLENETIEDLIFRNKLALKEANNNATIVAYEKAGFDYEIKSKEFYIAYLDKNANTDLRIGDSIIEVDNIKIESKEQISKIIETKKIGDIINFKVLNDDKEYKRKAEVVNVDDTKIVGIAVYEMMELETDPKIEIINEESESGPSGGLMTALAIYDSLIEEDLTSGNTIIGTGTIDASGNVGSIGGVKYKLLGAVKNKAKIFIVPNGENYDEAMKLKNENNYDIEIIGVSTFEDTLENIKEYNKK